MLTPLYLAPGTVHLRRFLRVLEERWQEERVGEGLLRPFYVAVGARWITWIVALGIISLAAAEPRNLHHGGALLAATGFQLLLMSFYLPVVRPHFPRVAKWLESSPALLILDGVWSLIVVHLSGGWGSPFYLFALNSVLAPALKYQLRAEERLWPPGGSRCLTSWYCW